MARGKYARKRQLRQLRECALEDALLPKRVVKPLEKAGICNMADLMVCSDEKLRTIPGIGEKAIQEILAVKEAIKKEQM